jgi:hypothetical protein
VDGLISAAAGGDWSYGASILTFAFPMILFIAVAGALWVLYTMPHLVPGHRYLADRRQAATAPSTDRAGGQAAASGPDQAAASREDQGAASREDQAAAGGTEDG